MTFRYLFFSLLFVKVFIGCDKDDPVITNEEELITTLNYSLTPSGGGTAITLSFVDMDGDGGDPPIITGGTLAPNQLYTGTITVLNEAETPIEDITVEVNEEAEDHQFFFASDIANLAVQYNDSDADGNPIGLSTTLTTGDVSTGSLTITLRHEPNKSTSGVSDGDIANAGGETDIEVTIPIEVQ